MSINFLLGSGISIPVGMPSVKTITDEVMFGEGWEYSLSRWSKKNKTFVEQESKPSNPDIPDILRNHQYPTTRGGVRNEPILNNPEKHEQLINVRRFLTHLYCLASQYYSAREKYKNREPNYEDLYYLADQLTGDDYDNPAMQPAQKHFSKLMAPHLGHNDFAETAKDSKSLIRSIVLHLMDSEKIVSLEKLFKLAELFKRCQSFTIFSLNHDLVLEKLFKEHGIEFDDGFIEDNYLGFPCLGMEKFLESDRPIKLVKMHGSLDWHTDTTTNTTTTCKSGPNNDCVPEYSPHLLIGTHNKILTYTTSIFLDMLCMFRNTLRKTDTLVVCGYGFGDKGINAQIVDWIEKPNRKMVVIDPNVNQFKDSARSAIRNKWGLWELQKKLVTIKSGIECFDLQKLVETLNLDRHH